MATILSILNQLKHHHSTTAAAAAAAAAAAVKSNGITNATTTSPSSSAAEFAKLIDPVISHIFVFNCADDATATATSTTINSASYYKFDDAKKESLLNSIVDAFQLRDVEQRDAVINRVKSAFDWKNNAVTSLM
jgi:hypothetical protein